MTRRELLQRLGLAGAAAAVAPILLPGMGLAGEDEPEVRAEPVELKPEPFSGQQMWYGASWEMQSDAGSWQDIKAQLDREIMIAADRRVFVNGDGSGFHPVGILSAPPTRKRRNRKGKRR